MILYFSATGNSEYVAKRIAAETGIEKDSLKYQNADIPKSLLRVINYYNSNESSASTHICKFPSRYNLTSRCINVNTITQGIVFCK